MTPRTKIILVTIAIVALSIGAIVIGRSRDERERERGRIDCRERGGRFTELHGRQEGWSCAFPEKDPRP